MADHSRAGSPLRGQALLQCCATLKPFAGKPAPTGDRRTRRYRLLALASFVVILVFLSLPGHWIAALQSWVQLWWPWSSSDSIPSNFPTDKLIHGVMFATCAALVVRGWAVCLMLFLYGMVTELIQRYVPGRSASLGDFLADGVGVLIGVGVALVYLRKRARNC